jgi:two-component system chemotaxis response regulator CheB
MRSEPALDQIAEKRPSVVAVGSSADGLGVLARIVGALPADYPGVVMVVQHLSPRHPSRLAALLARRTKLTVKEAVQGEPLRPGTVYLAPPDLHLTAQDGQVRLSDGTRVNYSRPSVDVLFESVARVYGPRAIGIVLSGANVDGARGLQAIRRAGGTTIVLAPEDARVSRMPRAAIGQDGIDFVVGLDAIAPLLRRLVEGRSDTPVKGDSAMSSVRPSVQQKTDREVHRSVLEELKWDPRVDETDVGVEVDGGVVTLTGTVTSWAKRHAAQEAARRVAGVRDVANDVVVKMPGDLTRTDTEIAQAVRQALQWDVLVPDERITSTVTNGCVTLDGTVDRLTERDDAERAIRNLRGVTTVLNRITVAGQPSQDIDARIERSIERALDRRAERQARRITVRVSDGVATVSGPVNSWAERRAVLGAIRNTRGVLEVQDSLWPEA